MDLEVLIQRKKVRRIFRAKRKLTAPHLVSHITQRAAGKDPLFIEDSDYLYMLGLMKEISEKHALDIYAFCLMPNHIHLLLSPREGRLSEALRDLFGSYALMFNRKYERKGHLFAGPYRQAVCLDDAYLLVASLYIHLNPVRAGLVKNPQDYRWSSVNLFLNPEAPPSFVKPEFILRLLGKSPSRARKIYGKLLTKSISLSPEEVLEKEDTVRKLCRALAKLFPNVFKEVLKKKQIGQQTGLNLLDEEELVETFKNLRLSNPRSPETKKGRRFVIEQLMARGYKRKEIAKMLGVSPKTIYNILKEKV